jgi:hypothetical protein
VNVRKEVLRREGEVNTLTLEGGSDRRLKKLHNE